MLLKRGSALTSAHSAEPMGKAISSASLPNSISFPRKRANLEIPSDRTSEIAALRREVETLRREVEAVRGVRSDARRVNGAN